MTIPRNLRMVAILAATTACVLAAPAPAQAWVRFGFGFVPFGFAPYPYYYAPPPVYYAPPAYYAPPVYAPAPNASGPACYAGQYVCPLTQSVPAGAPCSCPSNDGGRLSGRVN